MKPNVTSILAVGCLAATSVPAVACPNARLDHVAVLVENTDAVVASLKSEFGTSAFTEIMKMSDPGFGQIDLTYAPIGDGWLEFVQPVGPGPITNLLKKLGSGTIIELNFETSDLKACAKWLAARDVPMTDVNGKNYEGSGTFGSVIQPYGLRFAYVDQGRTGGATVEFFQRTDRPDDYLKRRDVWYRTLPKRPSVTFGAVNVEVRSLDISMQNFQRIGFPASLEKGFCPKGECRSAIVQTNGMPIRLYQPLALGPENSENSAPGPDVIKSISVMSTKNNHNRKGNDRFAMPELFITSRKHGFIGSVRSEQKRPGLQLEVDRK